MAVTNAASDNRTVASPNAIYESLKPLWVKSRAVCSGERFVKDFDGICDVNTFSNLLIPFSPSMTQKQYNFYKAEAELPGIVAQFAKMLVGGLLRKQPLLTLPKEAPEDAYDWIMENFGQDDAPLAAFMDDALWEEMQTSRSWIHVDYPRLTNYDKLDKTDVENIRPYPVLWDAESVVNWHVGIDSLGKSMLTKVIKRGFVEDYNKNEFHPAFIEYVWVHELDNEGYYQVRVYRKSDPAPTVPVVSGKIYKDPKNDSSMFELEETITNILMNNERLRYLPIWPLSGNFKPSEPMLMPIIDKEISLYNKLSRRNHLLYGAATYTPVISSDMTDESFQTIVDAGLGSWLHIGENDKASVLETPTQALKDMESAIASAIEEMAKLGIRMLAPESNSDQSGIALEIRNAAQTAQLGTLNNKVSNVLSQIIVFMLNWKYDLDYSTSDIEFSLSADFNPIPLGADWLRLATEWYENGLIPRSIWIQILKQNDIIPPDYDDEEGSKEINEDERIINKIDEMDYAAKLAQEANKANLQQ